ncbi:MAG: hypothetical protein KGS10_03615 [Chloroflexi bacterium]|nr:hypothetical protein [Chloroflexota bacterium]
MKRLVQAQSPSSTSYGDLHLHTNRSDGAMSVAELLAHMSRRTPPANIDERAALVEAWTRVRDVPTGSGPRTIVGYGVTASW